VDVYRYKNTWKVIFLLFALLIGVLTLFYTEGFLQKLRQEEVKRVQIWAQAVQDVTTSKPGDDLTLESTILQSNTTIPVILTDEQGNIIDHANLNPRNRPLDDVFLQEELAAMKAENDPIEIPLPDDQKNLMYFKNSVLLSQLRMYPVVLLGVIALFMGIAYWAFSTSRRSEQNRVWTGMARETAHQIGTPLTSLLGWIEVLRSQGVAQEALEEMESDVQRLNEITDRFSKIGSQPNLKPIDLGQTVDNYMDYLGKRLPKGVQLHVKVLNQARVHANVPLLAWVIENLVKNSTDAVEGKGHIAVEVGTQGKWARIDVTDNGKGISRNDFKRIFRPGFTTKSRGWGLGLSLAKRIVEEYHRGRIGVVKSQPGLETTIRIYLPLHTA
jgi:signal transduction histidine kinase